MPTFAANQEIGRWRLLDPLGEGGNGEVWRATDGGQQVALKLVVRRGNTEAFRRFAREVDASAALDSMSGILPVLGSHVPPDPSRRDPAWIAMPIATPVREALAGAELEEVVEAVASFAETLAAIAAADMAHRDIKPNNLYRYLELWAVGDFGLIDIPGADALTRERLGPFGFMPDEMFIDAQHADGKAVDVFQLAKTFSVLVTGQVYPPQGEIAAGSSGALSRFVNHARILPLEELIERCTRRDPQQRPRMADVAAELRAWLTLPPPTSQADDLSALAARFRAANASGLHEMRHVDGMRRRFARLYEQDGQVRLMLDGFAAVFVEAGLEPVISTGHRFEGRASRRRGMGTPAELMSAQRWVTAPIGVGIRPDHLSVGISCDLNTNGEFWSVGMVAAGDMVTGSTRTWMTEEHTVSVENSAALEKALAAVREELLTDLADALSRLAS